MKTRRVAMLAYDGAQVLDVTGPLEVFSMACRRVGAERGTPAPYAVEVLGLHSGIVSTSSGIRVGVDRAFPRVRGGIDTLLVCGGGGVHEAARDARLLAWLRIMHGRVRRLASVCTGAFLLAEAGLLDGRRATTHWASVPTFGKRFPRVRVEPDAIFVRDGNVYTSAGVTAGIDLALAMVEEDLGHDAAQAVARGLVVFLRRPGGQSQFSSHLQAQCVPRGPLKDLPAWIAEHVRADLSVAALAARAAMSPRHFARVFVREAGVTPAKFVERARVDAARRLLENGGLGLSGVADRCGFASGEQMRRTFLRHLRVVPVDYRRRFRTAS